MALLTAGGCVLRFWSELFGTWVATFGSDIATLVFGSTTMTMEAAGSMNGMVEFTLDDFDESAHHIEMTATSI